MAKIGLFYLLPFLILMIIPSSKALEEDICRVNNATNNALNKKSTLVLSSIRYHKKLWFHFGDNFEKLIFRLRMKNTFTSSSPFMLDEELILKKTEILATENVTSWTQLTIEIFPKSRIGMNTYVFRTVINKRAFDLDTQLWWRNYLVEEFYIYTVGDLQYSELCDPSLVEKLLTSTNISPAAVTSSREVSYFFSSKANIRIFSVVAAVLLIVIAILVVTICCLKRRRKVKPSEKAEKEPVYETLEEIACKKTRFSTSQPLPPIPYQKKASTEDATRTSAPSNIYASVVPSLKASTYDVPKRHSFSKSQDVMEKKEEESHYIQMHNFVD